jgi:hypothetical protein
MAWISIYSICAIFHNETKETLMFDTANLTRAFYRGKLLAGKYSPEIMLVAGIAGMITATVLACKATLKVETLMEKAETDLDRVEEAVEKYAPEVYSDDDYRQDKAIVHVQRAVSIGMLYLPAAVLGAASIALLIGSHKVMDNRNNALVVAYTLLDRSYKAYRERTEKEVGPEKEDNIRHNMVEKEETDENGDKKMVKHRRPGEVSEYARFFDSSSVQWHRDSVHNMFFLKSQQNYANDMLRAHGHIFLNEVYDLLALPRSQAGAVVGWVLNSEGDNFVDFGLFDKTDQRTRDLLNGYAHDVPILVDFNVDGVIYDLI